MMEISELKICNFRNIRRLTIDIESGINWIIGGNGSGKSSILEAVHMLVRGRSFRKCEVRSTIKDNEDSFQIVAIGKDIYGIGYRIEMKRGISEYEVKINGKKAKKISEVAERVPLHIITHKTQEIFESGPSFRRNVLDWGVFHVEHSYRNWISRYKRALTQRNAALKKRNGGYLIWDRELTESGAKIDQMRRKYLTQFEKIFLEKVKNITSCVDVTIDYKNGWRKDQEFTEALIENRDRDEFRGYTGVGIHRSDFLISTDGVPIEKKLSRGELKKIAVVFVIAQACLLASLKGDRSFLLVDDLQAELDKESWLLLVEELDKLGFQSLIAELDLPKELHRISTPSNMFHVKHGELVTDL